MKMKKISHLSTLKIPVNIENTDFWIKYIEPFMWEGKLIIDGGWGPKTEVLELTKGDEFSKLLVPLMVKPSADFNDENRVCSEWYNVSFPGEAWKIFLNMINEIKSLTEGNQIYQLKSFLSTKIPSPGDEIFELVIEATKDDTTVIVNQGFWVPSFNDTLMRAKWNHGKN